MQYETIEFYTGLPVILSPAPETPRMALAVTMRGGISREPVPGMAKMASRLLLKGTETRSAEALALELDERGIMLRDMVLADSSLLLAVFLNRELPAVLDLLEDILFHSTFADFDKEAGLLAGEIQSSLDHPSDQAQDLLLRTLFEGHPYGYTGTRILESLPQITQEATRQWFTDGLDPRAMNITLVGDFDPEEVAPRLDETFADLTERLPVPPPPAPLPPIGNRFVAEAKADAQQAQVYRGWLAPAVGAREQAQTSVMNTVLGAAGLSSRLFVELRDKQGLAYTVRSQYQPMRECGEFLIFIGTSPENIGRARLGFAEQVTRMQDEPISLDELQNAKGRLQGTYALAHETTSQRCLDMSLNHINGLSPNYSAELLEHIAGVTIADVQTAAQMLKAPSVTAIVAQEKYLPDE